MQITELRIRKVDDDTKLRAYVTVTFDNCFVVHNVKVYRRTERSFYSDAQQKDC